jgi:uncharacterized protein YdeI (YjbR/CyaY-like superfamily)
MTKASPKIDALFARATTWIPERAALRALLLDTPLDEDMKWGKACYGWKGANVAILFAMKDRFGLGFFKGALMSDPHGRLTRMGEHSQAMRLFSLRDSGHISEMEPVLRAYIDEAIAIETAGLKVDFREKHDLVLPDELLGEFATQPALKAAFDALTPGRQRGYVLHFSGAKQAATRTARIKKHSDRILAGKGMNDR